MTTLYDIDLLQSRIHHLESENDGLVEVASELNRALLQVAQERDDLRQKLEKSELRNRQYSDALHNISHYIQKQCDDCDRVESCVAPTGSDPKDYSLVEIVWIRGVAFVNAKKHEEAMERVPDAAQKMYDVLLPLEKILPEYNYPDSPYLSTEIDDKNLIGLDLLQRAVIALRAARKEWPKLKGGA